ncbi:MAG: type II toxin-antitoxin system PemK/MazF family toxin [Bryobacter sp.]|jgi:mRNA interferase MazF|nr:type II toxin-antitoxin system PemK/MazF family toxin [Bryobacter sp.]
MRRRDIYWCDLDPRRGHEQGDRRPVVIVSVDPYNQSASPLICVVPLTRAVPKNPLHVELVPADTGLKMPSTALVDHARFVDRERLSAAPCGRVVPSAQARIDRNLAMVLGL